jgi:DNA-directed RNA polymerase specialized sigma24 family protein
LDRVDSIVIGPTLVGYRREPDVERQLEQLRSAPHAIVHRVATDRDLKLETLVSVARSYVRADADKEAGRVLEQIAQRVTGRIYRHLQVWGVRNADDRDDLVQELLHMLFACVRSLGREQAFWECRFWVCFDRRAQSLLRNWANSGRPGVSLDELAETDPDLLRDHSPISTFDRAAAREALAQLPEPLRTTFYLKYLMGYQEEGGDGQAPTIAKTLGVTGRTVRNYLRRAEILLAEWRCPEAT